MTYRRFKYRSVILFFLAASSWASAQVVLPSRQLSVDQLLQYYRSLKDPSQQRVLSNELHDGKCGLGIRAQVHSQWNAFSTLQKIELKQQMVPPSTQKERVIGRFKIFYDTSGTPNVPALLDANNQPLSNTAEAYVDSVGAIFNYVYSVEVDGLGYIAPPHEQVDSYYRIFIQDMSDYGFTDWDESLPPLNSDTTSAPRYPCWVQVHNDFSGFYTKGMNALKVTAAHEFHHVIQIGSYGFHGDEVYAHELTSTWMEDVVYTDVNDYYQYLSNYFNLFSVGLSFNYYSSFDYHYGGYERCIWGHYLAKRFGIDIMRDVWTAMRTQPFLESNDYALANRGSNLQTAFAEFTYWNYYTADRSDTIKYYSEGNNYPRFQPLQRTAFNNADITIGGDVSPLSSSMYEFDVPHDTITAIIANVDVSNARNNDTAKQKIDITLSSQSLAQPYYKFKNGLNAKITPEDTTAWRSVFSQESTRIDSSVIKPNMVRLEASPNPFRLAEAKELLLPINADNANNASVFFYSSSLGLVYSGESIITYRFGKLVIVVAASEVKSQLSSGIYFVVARTKNNDYRWKVAVIR
ncbi:MAG: MXAN_6640 family putative metalloprotease [Bacteroidota bacterium]|jgi:hypothetical protein